MKPVLSEGRELIELDSVDSTQSLLANFVREGRNTVAAVLAHEQTAGKGRAGRTWYSPRGESLSLSLALYDYADWPAPQFLSMAIAVAAAEAFDCDLAWPNDLVINPSARVGSKDDGEMSQRYRKVGGVLSEIVRAPSGTRIPVVGMGVNLAVAEFPQELEGVATSLALAGRERMDSAEACRRIISAIERVPEPNDWPSISASWERRDCTIGKLYRMPDGRIARAVRVGDRGQLVAVCGSDQVEVPSAEALFGDSGEI